MTQFDDLLAAKAAADGALAEAEQALLGELVAAKDAHRADPTEENAARKHEAATAVQAFRAVVRAGRTRVGVGGDVVPMSGVDQGGEG